MFRSMEQVPGSSLLAAENRVAPGEPGCLECRAPERRATALGLADCESLGRRGVAGGGGAVLLDGASMDLHVAGFPDLALETRLVRRQLATRARRCALRFVDTSDEQRRILGEMLGADHAAAPARRRALLVHVDQAHIPALATDVAALGFSVRSETSTGQAAAWLQRESADLLLVEHRVVETDRRACSSSRTTPRPKCGGSSWPRTCAASGSTSP